LSRRVLVTGATGFVGRYLLRTLVKAEELIWGTSFPDEPDPAAGSDCQDICHLDLRDAGRICDLIKTSRPDWIFHLAAVSSVGYSWHNRSETLQTNLLGTLNLLEAVRCHAPEAKLLFVSSSNVYGNPTGSDTGIKEAVALSAISPYAFSKISGEMLCRFYTDIEGLSIVMSRSFPHTGPGQSTDFVCSDWAEQVAKIEKGRAEPVIKTGNIAIQRDFTDVRDVVKAYEMLMRQGKIGAVYNVASGEAVALRSILDILLSMAKIPITISTDPSKIRKTDISCLLGDNRKIKTEIGWMPTIPIRQTLRDLLDYWRAKD